MGSLEASGEAVCPAGESANGSPAVVEDSTDSEPEFTQYKIILLGDGAVGKTSLAQRFAADGFGKEYKQTIGIDFLVKRITLPPNVNVCLQIWDIGGQSIGGKMVGTYINGSDAVMLCYDITNYQSFTDLHDWNGLVAANCLGKKPKLALVGTKSDLNHLRAVKADKAAEFAERESMEPFLVSSMTGDQVDTAFYKIAASLAGVNLTTSQMEVQQKVIKAEIITHEKDDTAHPSVNATRRKEKKKCTIM